MANGLYVYLVLWYAPQGGTLLAYEVQAETSNEASALAAKVYLREQGEFAPTRPHRIYRASAVYETNGRVWHEINLNFPTAERPPR